MVQTPRPAADAGISIGQILLGKYRVDAILGQGGMGVVAKCTHLALNELYAIKMLRQDVMLDRDATERFMREAQAASKLKSEHVARVIDVGTFPDSGVPYMVMEFLDGQDLGTLLDEQQSIQPQLAAMMMLQAAEALAEAHSIGIVHRDVKPTNLFITWRPDGTSLIKVLDFGISKAPMGTDMQLTQTQSLLGTPAYMSPEQMRSARLVDARTDVWSLGTVMYELLEGRRPFEAESFSEMCVKVAVDPPEPMVHAPPELQPIVMRCLAKAPEQRYASMAELARDLLPFVQDVHQGALLVERMQRMIARRAVDWDNAPGTNGGRVATPLPMMRSGGVASQFQGDSNPAATPLGGVQKTPPPGSLRLGSAPVISPSEPELVPPRKRSKLAWVLVPLLVIGAAAGGAFAMWNQQDEGGPSADGTATQPVADPTQPASPDPTKVDAAKVDPAKADPAKAEPKAGPAVADAPADEVGAGSATDPTTDPATDPAKDPGKPTTAELERQRQRQLQLQRQRQQLAAKNRLRQQTKKDPKADKPDKPDKPEAPPCPPMKRLPGGGCSDN